MAMDAKDLRTETALSERNNHGSKYSQSGVATQCNRNKTYQDIGSNPLAKTESGTVRPCAVIGPDRVVPPPANNDAYLKKGPIESWTCPDNMYPRPPEYTHKLANNQNPSRNISPRQTFQENMQRIMVPPSYNTVKANDDSGFSHVQERTPVLTKNIKPNMPTEGKYCEVPYTINPMTNEHKNLRDSEMCVPSVNSPVPRAAPHMWPSGSVNLHAPRAYGAHEIYQYPQYPSCAGPRQPVMPVMRSHRTFQDEPGYVYSEPFYQDPNMRFKPYPPVKERYPQPRYEYISNYPGPFHPPTSFPTHKYDISKPGQPHPYPIYPHLKYVDNRLPEPPLEGHPYTRPTNPPNYNIAYRNQVLHSNYNNAIGTAQNKVLPYPTDSTGKPIIPNKVPYDNNNKVYIDYENARSKPYSVGDTYFVNDVSRIPSNKNQPMMPPNYTGVHPMPQQFYRKDILPHIKSHEFMPHFRNFDPPLNAYPMMRHQSQFSPNNLAISPTDSITSNDTIHTHGTNLEDCGYVSQSSTASIRSLDSGINRIVGEYYKRPEYRYGHSVTNVQIPPKSDMNNSSKDKKQINLRQFLQMWNEGDDDDNTDTNGTKEIIIQTGNSNNTNNKAGSQEQLYVLGLVNVPSEELAKYEHIQKVSKLPENIKGYNSIELLNQFEEAIESTKTKPFQSTAPKEYQMPLKENRHSISKQMIDALPRPLSPLDVEAKISQSVIHKEVGCNFEIKPCSPKMLSVEVAAPIQNILEERIIEKVNNPLSKIITSPLSTQKRLDENVLCNNNNKKDIGLYDNPSCKMISSPFSRNSVEPVKTDYSLQDLETNSGVCLASLPRLDNDIELNFPEVNQQFIDANKIETKDVYEPSITSESSVGLEPNQEQNIQTKATVPDTIENEYMKLSKYRKTKTTSIDHCEDSPKNTVIRTDSVIIKNPENTKKSEEDKNVDFAFQLVNEDNIVPMNLSSGHNLEEKSNTDLDLFVKTNVIESYSEDALDFSMNKIDNLSPTVPENNVQEMPASLETSEPVTSEKEILNKKEKHIFSETYVSQELSNENNKVTKSKIGTEIEEMLNSVAEKVVSSIDYTDENVTNVENSEVLHKPTDNLEKIGTCFEDKLLETTKKDMPVTDFDNNTLITPDNSNIGKSKTTINPDKDQQKINEPCDDNINTDTTQSVTTEDHERCSTDKKSTKINSNEYSSLHTVVVQNPCPTLQWASPEIRLRQDTDNDFGKTAFVHRGEHKNETFNDSLNNSSDDNTNDNCKSPVENSVSQSRSDFDNIILPNQEAAETEGLNYSDLCTNMISESVILKNDNVTFKNINKRKLHKELYSPWVQKLLLYSEGFLSCPSPAVNEVCDRSSDISKKLEHSHDQITSPQNHDSPLNETDSICETTLIADSEKVSATDWEESAPEEKSVLSPDSKYLTNNNSTAAEVDISEDNINIKSNLISIMNENIPESSIKDCCDEDIESSQNQIQKSNEFKELLDINSIENEDIPSNTILSNENSKVTENDIQSNTTIDSSNDHVKNVIQEVSNEEEIEIFKENMNIGNSNTEKCSKNDSEEPKSYENTCNINDEIKKQTTNAMGVENMYESNLLFSENYNEALDIIENNLPVIENPKMKDCDEEFAETVVPNDNFQIHPRKTLKRSFSESDLSSYKKTTTTTWPSKRKKIEESESIEQNIAKNICRLINNNRRNSISSIHNEENVQFCILIEDNCIINEESEEDKICYAEISDNCTTEIDSTIEDNGLVTQVLPTEGNECEFTDSVTVECQEDEANDEEQWVEDIACIETVVSDDVAEDIVISTSSTPERNDVSDFDESGVYCNSLTDHTDKVKLIYGENMSDDDAQIIDTLFRTPQMDVNKTLVYAETVECEENYIMYDDNESLEKMLSESDNHSLFLPLPSESEPSFVPADESVSSHSYENKIDDSISSFLVSEDADTIKKDEDVDRSKYEECEETQVGTVHSCESSVDNVFNYKQKDDDIIYSSSSSPEVSSTTSEEKNSSILLKITNYNGSRVSEINEVKTENRPRCKFTEKKVYSNSNFPNRPLLTKAAQKYIPPIKETIRDLKVKISLPQQSLLKLKQLKMSKSKPNVVNKQCSVVPLIPKKPKPNFEDVLKSIDEIQFKMHKEKSKKSRNTIPKVVIKKNENGSHYASTSSKDSYNPDLTGRKWQPWVILEKNNFIDKMALRNKTRAIFNHRKNTYVLAEKFKKYKSVSSAKFVITQPKSNEMGHLKYTIKLKHSY